MLLRPLPFPAPDRLPRFLDVWGIAPARGRGFTEAEHRLGGPSVVIISDGYWRRQLCAGPDVLERSVRMGDRACRIVGVLPASFRFPVRGVDWWVPQWTDAPWTQNRTYRLGSAIGRLLPGVTVEQARADLALLQADSASSSPRRTVASLR